MGFKTPFESGNTGAPLNDFGFYKIIRHSKGAICEMLKNFFTVTATKYSLTIPEVIIYQSEPSATEKPLFISRDFPYQQMKLPLIVVSARGGKEKKLFYGADNHALYDIRETSTGKTGVEIFTGAYLFETVMIPIANSPEQRMQLSELISMCFTHYYRWQYFYTLGDGNMYSLVPNSGTLSFGSEQVAEGSVGTDLLYVTDIAMPSYVEYTFRGLDIFQELKSYTVDPESGPEET